MACCVFMAIVITNILVFYRKFKAMLGIKTEGDSQSADKPALWLRSYKVALPVALVSVGVFLGVEHWEHMMQWLNLSECGDIDAAQCHAHHH